MDSLRSISQIAPQKLLDALYFVKIKVTAAILNNLIECPFEYAGKLFTHYLIKK